MEGPGPLCLADEDARAASVRHEGTGYDELLMSGVPRTSARERVGAEVQRILARWQVPGSS